MNRHERRKATACGQTDRQRTIADAVSALDLAAASDSTISGATLMLPTGEMIYLPVASPSQVNQ